MRLRFAWISIVLIFGHAGIAKAATPSWAPVADRYLQELDRVEHATKRVSMEALIANAFDLVEAIHEGSGSMVREAAQDSGFTGMGGKLRGLSFHGGDGSAVTLNADFFRKLGERKGRVEDRLFLRLYERTYPESDFPAYVQQQTDETGCVDFGSGKLVALFGEWSKYGAKHPRLYADVVTAEMQRIRENLTKSTCACGSSGSVQSELRFFLRRFPNDPAAPRVRERFEEVRRGVSSLRFNCVSG